MKDDFEYYYNNVSISNPGTHAPLFDPLPGDISALVKVVQGLMIHVFWIEKYGIQLDAARKEEVQLRTVERMLARIQELDPRPLSDAREPAKKLVGNCRDFSVLLAAMLRHKGIPARARCGFAEYFIPKHHEDHWVVEYWNAKQQRWVLVDAQLDELQRNKLRISFDPLNVPRDQFLIGGRAWQLCRSGQADPVSFGIFDMKGLWYVRGNFIRDVASLNKMELLPWDAWGLIEGRDEEISQEDLIFLDKVAELVARDVPEITKVMTLYEIDPRLKVPGVIKSYTQAGVQTIELSNL